MGKERRTHTRHSVFGGNAEITSVFGRGRTPAERARILNWSRGGVLLKVASPRRKMMFLKAEPVLFDGDSFDCVIRLAPAYKKLAVHGDVVHVELAPGEPDQLLVGVAFDEERTPEQSTAQMVKILEPKSRSGRHKKISASHSRVTSRLKKVEATRPPEGARRSGRKSARLRQSSSGRVDAV